MTPTPGWFYHPLDPADPWLSADQWTVFGWAAAIFALGWARGGAVRGWVAVIAGALLIELIEVARYQAWSKAGFPQPWPWLTDKISSKDLFVALLGALVMQKLLP